jgi:hypothetical protein
MRDNEFFGFFYDRCRICHKHYIHCLITIHIRKSFWHRGVFRLFFSPCVAHFYLHFLPGFRIVAVTLDLLFPPSQDLTI